MDGCIYGVFWRVRVVVYRRDEMWFEGWYEYERILREWVFFWSYFSDGYNRLVNIVLKKLLLLDRFGEGSYNRYYSYVDYWDYDEGCSFFYDWRSGLFYRGDEFGYRWIRDDYFVSR